MTQECLHIMTTGGVKPTANRILVMNTLLAAPHPMSLIEIETALETLDRSSISRALTVFVKHDVVHVMEDGRGVAKYEVCHGHGHCSMDDMHVHFFCERCETTFCFEDSKIPQMNIPKEFEIHSANFMLKGLCAKCRGKVTTACDK